MGHGFPQMNTDTKIGKIMFIEKYLFSMNNSPSFFEAYLKRVGFCIINPVGDFDSTSCGLIKNGELDFQARPQHS